jgi:hypothetical protein
MEQSKNMNSIRLDILPEIQRRLVPVLAPVAREFGYYLAGGTAVALYFGHRESVDFDFFASDPIVGGQTLLDQLVARGLNFQPADVDPRTLNGSVEGVRVSFFRYPYPFLSPALDDPDSGLSLASVPDLCAMKLSALIGRDTMTRKDFIDIHRMMLEGTPLTSMLGHFTRKYANQQVIHVLRTLVYFDEVESQAMPKLHIPVTWDQIKQDISTAVRDASRRPGV